MALCPSKSTGHQLATSTTGWIDPSLTASRSLRHFLTLGRIWAAIKRETLLTLAEGVASPEEIDSIFKDVLKTPKGPCEQMDVVGLDVVLDIEQHYADVRQGIPEEPRALLRKMVAQGKLGVKSGSGFYDYAESSKPVD